MEPNLIAKEALLRYINDADNQVGITTIFAYGDITKLPKSCKTIIQSDDTRTGYYIKNKNANRFIPFALDNIETSHIRSLLISYLDCRLKEILALWASLIESRSYKCTR